jgi:hypothetical protein
MGANPFMLRVVEAFFRVFQWELVICFCENGSGV